MPLAFKALASPRWLAATTMKNANFACARKNDENVVTSAEIRVVSLCSRVSGAWA